ncbi:tripartite motif-containing protein 42-like isoform X1 [Hylaeus volcanicus]|uniref:tripartite motif-containing protein 42-like isoform X1 n=1 Tax=Hylaeus volcanicus TaxID=313075 RepID=UPI0023B7E661|nr:tripartite motif-containing protein 42-like isoform X1 [Hylaeus volcanicus]XP_053988518.1 tripartite motif-containing protein 42-like isoform X1 [Hylaeus volcanicus]
MDFVKCFKYQSIRNCCGERTSMDSENENNEFPIKERTFPKRTNKIGDTQKVVNTELPCFDKSERYDDYSKLNMPLSWHTNGENSMYRVSKASYDIKDRISNEYEQEEILFSPKTGEDIDFQCPRCSKRMHEPRLLPCLHPICSPCVSELMSKPLYTSMKGTRTHGVQSEDRPSNFYELCSLCDFRLPNVNSPIPPPHYPLQHRLVMDAIRCKLANRVLCDTCTDEVIAHVQCSTCLRNFCSACGIEHQQQVVMELRPSKHLMRPIWEATKVRRTALCQKHPTHALRFYCIACRQVTCKECIWSTQHRGHASENAAGAGKRVALYLTSILQRAKTLLNLLLTQYNRKSFMSGTFEEMKDTFISRDYRYVKQMVMYYS